MAVKSKRYREMLEKESRKKQPLVKAHLKAAVKSGGFSKRADKYDRPSKTSKAILAILRAIKKRGKNGKKGS